MIISDEELAETFNRVVAFLWELDSAALNEEQERERGELVARLSVKRCIFVDPSTANRGQCVRHQGHFGACRYVRDAEDLHCPECGGPLGGQRLGRLENHRPNCSRLPL